MKYINASEVLPQGLLKEIQKFAAGTLLYIPKDEADNKSWGEVSVMRKYLLKRNRMIINHFRYGVSIEQISKNYYLSEETIKKIVSSRKNTEQLIFRQDVQSAEDNLLVFSHC